MNSFTLYNITNPDWDHEEKEKYGWTQNKANRIHNSHEQHSHKSKYSALYDLTETENYTLGYAEHDKIFSHLAKDEPMIKMTEDLHCCTLPLLRTMHHHLVEHGGSTEFMFKSGKDLFNRIVTEEFPKLGLRVDKIYDPIEIEQINEQVRIKNILQHEQNVVKYRLHIATLHEHRTNIASLCVSNAQMCKEQFFQTFIPEGCDPRRIQLELWEKYEKIVNENENYKGIVQWPTGTGKTIAFLTLIILTYQKIKKNNGYYRGLLIAPTNDIFNTLLPVIRKLKLWDIHVFEGHEGQFSSLNIPKDKDILVLATHASLTTQDNWQRLPPINHIHYDEVHRITGEEFFELLKYNSNFEFWNTPYITGTSATPKTCSASQHSKIEELFGSPLQIIHRCSVDEAIQEGWIAHPRFFVNILSKNNMRDNIIKSFIISLIEKINQKIEKNWQGGKVIAYLTSIIDVQRAIAIAKEVFPEGWSVYSAVDGTPDTYDDKQFVRDKPDGSVKVLFACERYREGSDIKGLEMTAVLMGNTMAVYILLQIIGRCLRNDYTGKEGWCLIMQPCEDDKSVDDVFDSIMFNMMEFMGKDDGPSYYSISNIRKIVNIMFHGNSDITISGKSYDIDETVFRIQSMFARTAFGESKEKYNIVKTLNTEMEIQSKNEYLEHENKHPKFIRDPKKYFENDWISWYHFLGKEVSLFPQTKLDWVCLCKDRNIKTWEEYKRIATNDSTLPPSPSEMYDDYYNWDKEFGVEAEHVW